MDLRASLAILLLSAAVAEAQGFPPVRKDFPPLERFDPQYPVQAGREGVSGRVVAQVHVAPSGKVTQVKIVSSTDKMFGREVIRALSMWTYKPEPVGFVSEYEVVFDPSHVGRPKPPREPPPSLTPLLK